MKLSIKKIIGNLISGNTRNLTIRKNNPKLLLRHIILVRLRDVWLVPEELLVLLLCETGIYCT